MLVKDIHSKFGKRPLKSFPLVDILTYKIYYRYVLGMEVFKPLNFVPYIKNEAEKLLMNRFGWQAFQHKHHESRFTRFYEDFWLPRKFGFDKRRAHFSSLILTGQMTRDEALERISKPELSEEFLQKEKTEIIYTYPKTIINKVEGTDIGLAYSLNPYQGCEHGCIYCYARNSHEYWGYGAGLDFERKIIVKKNNVRCDI